MASSRPDINFPSRALLVLFALIILTPWDFAPALPVNGRGRSGLALAPLPRNDENQNQNQVPLVRGDDFVDWDDEVNDDSIDYDGYDVEIAAFLSQLVNFGGHCFLIDDTVPFSVLKQMNDFANDPGDYGDIPAALKGYEVRMLGVEDVDIWNDDEEDEYVWDEDENDDHNESSYSNIKIPLPTILPSTLDIGSHRFRTNCNIPDEVTDRIFRLFLDNHDNEIVGIPEDLAMYEIMSPEEEDDWNTEVAVIRERRVASLLRYSKRWG